MKILYNHRIASKDGQFVHVEELTKAFSELGHELVIVAPKFQRQAEFGSDGGIVSKLKKILPGAIYELLELAYSVLIAGKLVKEIYRRRPDFIYERYNLYQPAGVIVAKLFNIPLVLEVNAPLVDERCKYSGLSMVKLARKVESFTWKQADVVLPVTEVLAGFLRKAGVNSKKIIVIHNGINMHLLENEFSKRDCFSDDRIVIGFVGFIHRWHRLDLALDAIALHKDKNICLLCIGDGEIRSELEKQAQILNISDKVTFTGLVSRDSVFQYIQKFDIALQPSVTSYASPLKLFEYLAASCLIIAPRSENICEIVSEENAILFTPDDSADFSQKLAIAVENYAEMSAKRINARELILQKKYSWQENAKRIVELVESRFIKA